MTERTPEEQEQEEQERIEREEQERIEREGDRDVTEVGDDVGNPDDADVHDQQDTTDTE